jgi:hypothetical protein
MQTDISRETGKGTTEPLRCASIPVKITGPFHTEKRHIHPSEGVDLHKKPL